LTQSGYSRFTISATQNDHRPAFVVGTIGNAPYWPNFREAMRDLGYSEQRLVNFKKINNPRCPTT